MLNSQLSPHFKLREFRCQKAYKDCPYCGGSIRVRNIVVYQAKVYRLEILRWMLSSFYKAEVEIIISRGDSCQKRNSETSRLDDPDLSQHWRGCAIDCFARIKETRVSVDMLRFYFYVSQLWPEDNIRYEGDHIHITLARTQETPP